MHHFKSQLDEWQLSSRIATKSCLPGSPYVADKPRGVMAPSLVPIRSAFILDEIYDSRLSTC